MIDLSGSASNQGKFPQQGIAIFGECMLELNRSSTDAPKSAGADGNATGLALSMSFGGDTLNTAVYLARQGCHAEYVTALGDDAYSDWMLAQWQAEGVGCQLVSRVPGSVPGLYLIERDSSGERSFLYWRDSAPVRRMFDQEEAAEAVFAQLAQFPCIYLSGISLGVLSAVSLQRLMGFLRDYVAAGGYVIFDGNYRPRLWESAELARDVYGEIYSLTSIALPTFEDEEALFGDSSTAAVIERLRAAGVVEIVLKLGEEGCLCASAASVDQVPAHKVTPVDTTAAGDSFNGGYLAARLKGQDCIAAAENGHRLASQVIQVQGAIIPRALMP